MSYKFTSESIRKRIKNVKAIFRSDDRSASRVDGSSDGTLDGLVTNLDSDASSLDLTSPRRASTSTASKTNGHNGHINVYHLEDRNGAGDYLERDESPGRSPDNHESQEDVPRGRSREPKGKEPVQEEEEITITNGHASPAESVTTSTVSTFVDPSTVFRAWQDDELQLQREVIEKYQTGAKLWTKEELVNIEKKINTVNPILLQSYVGPNQKFERQVGLTYRVEFHGYRDLAFPPPFRPNGMPYCPMTLKTMPYDYSFSRDLEIELDAFHKCTAIWLANPIGQQFYSMFMRLPLPPDINKVVCFNLGSITAKPADDHPKIRQAMYKHAAAMTIIEALHRRFGTVIQLFAQDTTYCAECTQVLFQKGFSVVGLHGAGGFAEIDDKTLVFAPNPGFCLKEIVADTAEPAAMFWDTVLSPEEAEKANRSHRSITLEDGLTSHWEYYETDPDTPRVRSLVENYERHPFPTTNLLGNVSLYTRKQQVKSETPSASESNSTSGSDSKSTTIPNAAATTEDVEGTEK